MKFASRKSERGLDWFTFFVADIQTGFGPFLAVYLTTQKWNQADIGLILAVGSIAGLVSQLPGGWLVDLVPSKRLAAQVAVAGIGASALLMAVSPSFLSIMLAKLVHVGSSSVLGPAIASITLGLVGHAAVGPRLGRNARFASIGNGLAAAVMGACGYLISPQAVFYVTAALALPTLLALSADTRERNRPDPGRCRYLAAHSRAPQRRHLGSASRPVSYYAGCLRFPVPRSECRDAAPGRDRDDAAIGSVGKRADCGVHRRASADRCDYRPWDRENWRS